MDLAALLKDLQLRAETAVESVDLDARVEDAKGAALKVKERLETDERARNLTIGGGVLLTALLATRGGRNLMGTVAKTGAAAALGALAYKAWQERKGAHHPAPGDEAYGADSGALAAAGYVMDDGADPAFSRAMVHAMAAAAYADGVIDPAERAEIDGTGAAGDTDLEALVNGTKSRDETLAMISLAARTPNHASQLYAAAVLATGQQSPAESVFLQALAAELGIAPAHAEAMARDVAAG
ncbi:MAG: DUF533 domain-containing protein [Pseudomonadota bacterium]